MAAKTNSFAATPAVASSKDFDMASGPWLERLIFNNRFLILMICALITAYLGFQASRLQINASFEKMMPVTHPYIQNYLKHADSIRGLGNSVRVVVANSRGGDIYDPTYLETLRKINDQVFLIPGVDRSFMKSLWTSTVQWNQITEEGFEGGPVMPDTYDGTTESIEQLRVNIRRSGTASTLVANDQKSSMLFVPLLERDAKTKKMLDYRYFRDELNKIRAYEKEGVSIHIIGFAELAGDLIHGLIGVFTFFIFAALITTVILFLYTRCMRSTGLVVFCSLVAVVWLLGLMSLLGYVLNPYSVLVPFLAFAIGMSHGSQLMNGTMHDIGRGAHKLVAARTTFRRLYLAGLTAIMSDAVGFAVLMLIPIPVIRELALTASIGVVVLIFTHLILLPIFLSHTGVSPKAAMRSLNSSQGKHPLVRLLDRFTKPRWAVPIIIGSVIMSGIGLGVAGQLKIGDLDPGAPELRPESQYNRDNAYITSHYQLSSDQLAVIVTCPVNGLYNFETLLEMDRLEEKLRELPGVQTTFSASSMARRYTCAGFEGSVKWITINRDIFVNNDALGYVHSSNPEMLNGARSLAPIIAFLADHKAETLTSVVKTVEAFAQEHNTAERKFLLAAGNSGIEAATNIAVAHANRWMLFYVYTAVLVLCFITFRSWRAVVVAVVPLVVTSILCQALMVALGIGVKVATLPVTALGVGIGVDYALYLLSAQLAFQRTGMSVPEAYRGALTFTGKIVALIGVTLSAAVITWYWSPIKFQADMGILLVFMFLWNMLGALILMPSLSTFLLRPLTRKRVVPADELLNAMPVRKEEFLLSSPKMR
ncbi:RND transporter [Desulfosarcina ovata subsp. sediminis]|uniref:RND transporter n=1 Tax=Desulfosarcina ovata subsp. sediminis TaxID=885957 RepID=A0A5K7ZIT8_9BACT|nr:MMPL family transporter [Desulfosarcina ovata]BBO82042.1 RND transporter [Desulfosarcina ovata subsp. sediminis]